MQKEAKFKIVAVGIATTATALMYPAGKACMFAFLYWFVLHNTVTPRGYSDANFNLIQKGMTESEARRVAGEPLETLEQGADWGAARVRLPDGRYYFSGGDRCDAKVRTKPETLMMIYTKPSPDNDMYAVRQVVVRKGRVVRIIKKISYG